MVSQDSSRKTPKYIPSINSTGLLKILLQWRNFCQARDEHSHDIFPKSGHLLIVFRKGQRRPFHTLHPPLLVPLKLKNLVFNKMQTHAIFLISSTRCSVLLDVSNKVAFLNFVVDNFPGVFISIFHSFFVCLFVFCFFVNEFY